LRRNYAVALGVALGSIAPPAYAIDTTETWDPGAWDLEAYGRLERSFDADRVVGLDAVVGYGIVTRLSTYAAGTVEYSEGGWTPIGGIGLFGTPLDTDHVDMDLFLGVEFASRERALVPAFELNLDAAPDLDTWGVFLRGDAGVHDHWLVQDLDRPADDEPFGFGFGSGAYVTLGHGHQLLAELDTAWGPETELSLDGVAVGYNVQLVAELELITAVSLGDPVQRGFGSPALLVGVIGTVAP